MNEKIIGENIRRARETQGLTVTAAARQAGLSKSALSKIETGNASPPISTLLRIGDALGVPLATLFSEPSARPDFVVTRKGRGERIVRDGSQFGYAYEALALGMTPKQAEPFLLTVQPSDPVGRFQHGGEEFMYVLSGKLEFTVGAERLTLGPGDSIYFDPRRAHTSKALGRTSARFLSVFIRTATATGASKEAGAVAQRRNRGGAAASRGKKRT